MTLDKQRILNDLGSVMNQLQNADCGCMGKLFSNPGSPNTNNMMQPTSNGFGGCKMGSGCCQHNWNQQGQVAGHNHSMSSCMGRNCDPAKLYAETYKFLQPNLMQPIMQEVRNDLKNISPQNTIMNNPMGAQMGLSAGNAMQPAQNENMNQMQTSNNMGTTLPINAMNTGGAADGMAGAGPQILNMMFGDSKGQNNNWMPGMPGQGMTGQGMTGQGMAGQGVAGQGVAGQGMAGQGMAGQGMAGQGMAGQGMAGQGMTGQGMTGQGMTGQGMTGQGMTGQGMTGQGMTGQGMTGQGMTGQGMTGQGMTGQGMTGQGMTGQGMTGQGMTGQGMTGQGMTGQGMTGQGMTGQGMTGQGMTGQGMTGQGMTGQGMTGQGMTGQGMTGQGMTGQGMTGQGMTGQAMPGHTMYGQPEAVGQGDTIYNNMNQRSMQQGNFGQGYVNPDNQQHYNTNIGQMNMVNPNKQYVSQSMYSNPNENKIAGMNNNMSNINNFPTKQMAGGVHAAGLAKFKAMFPGVNQDDLGFDPMSIALQMNPANQKSVAMDSINKMMNNNKLDRLMDVEKIAQARSPAVTYAQPVPDSETQQIPGNVGQYQSTPIQQQQAYMAYPAQSVNPMTQQLQNPAEYNGNPNDQMAVTPQHVVPTSKAKNPVPEPIYPVSAGRDLCTYNTLGQPVQMLPAGGYRFKEPALPQTLSPQPNYANVKNTVSKTSLMGGKTIGKAPSRGQLQHIYNQYKGSQSYTQQNIVPIQQRIHSDGRLNVPKTQAKVVLQSPVEKIGGDTLYSNPVENRTENIKEIMGQIGDVAKDKPNEVAKEAAPLRSGRNGLQDQAFLSYPVGNAWTFHGTNGDRVPFPSASVKRDYR